MEVICINEDFGPTRDFDTLQIVESVMGPKKDEILEPADCQRMADGTLCYQFIKYNQPGETNWFECQNFAILPREIQSEIQEALQIIKEVETYEPQFV